MKKTSVFLAAIMLWLTAALSDALAGVTIRMGHVGPPWPQQQAGDIFVKLVQTKTSGAVEIKLFGGSTLGTEQQLQEGVKAGSIDGLIAGTWERFIPWAGVFQAPFIFRDYDHFQKVVTGPVGQELMAAVEGELGVKPLFIVQHASFRRITNSARPIHKPEDMKG
jgi:TRAP-type C4-dicarboxylate transport system substrate-binding protein